MADFTLTPDEPDLPLRPQCVRLVSTGLHPTEALPASPRTGKDTPPCYQACEGCGTLGFFAYPPAGVYFSNTTL